MFTPITFSKGLKAAVVTVVLASSFAVSGNAMASGITNIIKAENALAKGNNEGAVKFAKTALRRGLTDKQSQRAYNVLCEALKAENSEEAVKYCKAQ